MSRVPRSPALSQKTLAMCLDSTKYSVRTLLSSDDVALDEILVNAADNIQRDKKTDTIKVSIDQKKGLITVWNNGRGIPI